MSRHRDPEYFRQYPQLVKMLYKEVVRQDFLGNQTAISNSKTILKKMAIDHPTADVLVLYVTQDRKSWLIVPVGPDEELKSLAQAHRQHFNGKHPVAYSAVK